METLFLNPPWGSLVVQLSQNLQFITRTCAPNLLKGHFFQHWYKMGPAKNQLRVGNYETLRKTGVNYLIIYINRTPMSLHSQRARLETPMWEPKLRRFQHGLVQRSARKLKGLIDDGGHPVGPWMMDVSTESLWCRFFFNFLDFLGMYLFIQFFLFKD